jgi:LMBR1-like membrane protein
MAAGVGSSIFFSLSLFVISLLVLLLLRYYLPIRSTPGYLLLPVFLSLALPSSIILLVPIDLASNAGTGAARGIWLPDRALLVAWRITYWLTFILTWYDLESLTLDKLSY